MSIAGCVAERTTSLSVLTYPDTSHFRIGSPAPYNTTDMPAVIIAHRTCPRHAPENSLQGIRRAAELGADGVEIDVQRTLDGVPILMHDKTLWRTAGLYWPARLLPYSLLRRLHLPNKFNEPQPGATIRRALVVDVEATGLSIENDDIIQLAMLPFDYEVETGRILTVHKDLAFEALREPAVAISAEASLITGITDDMVAGKAIDENVVTSIVSGADLIIAHNARFDRPMVERHWPCFIDKPWACTLDGVDWLHEGFSAGKLDYLGLQFGWFYDGHRAFADCEACLALLAQTLPTSGRNVLAVVREAALHDDFLVRAVDAPYDLRDKLKQRGYRWRPAEMPNGKVWWTRTADPEVEIAWLRAEVYGREAPIPVRPITACERYSDRLWNFEQ